LGDQRVGDGVEPEAAVLLRERGAEPAERRELGDDRTVHRLRAVPVARERRDLAVAELARGRADQLLLVRELEVHRPADTAMLVPGRQTIGAAGAVCTGFVPPIPQSSR